MCLAQIAASLAAAQIPYCVDEGFSAGNRLRREAALVGQQILAVRALQLECGGVAVRCVVLQRQQSEEAAVIVVVVQQGNQCLVLLRVRLEFIGHCVDGVFSGDSHARNVD